MRVTKANYYSIAGIYLKIEAEEKYLQRELKDFILPADQSLCETTPIVTISITEDQYVGHEQSKIILKGSLLTVREADDSFLILYNKPTCVCCYLLSKSENKAVIYLTKEAGDPKRYLNGDMMVELMYSIRDSFFYFLQKYERIVVHSASFMYNNEVWLISAPSGTGKSTHVELWKKKGYPIQDFNGDLAVCYLYENGNVMAAGIPWCGTSGIYVNRTVPLGGILFLQRSDTDMVKPLDQFQGILHLLGRCVTPNWTKEQADLNATIAGKVAAQTHLALLYCTKEGTAADVSKAYMDKISV